MPIAAPGIVAYSGDEVPGYGNMVMVVHPGGWVTMYAHNSANYVVAGERVPAGGVLAELGSTGISRGPHVHFELRHQGKVIDPFTGAAPGMACGGTTGSLWAEATRAERPYVATGLICAGWSAAAPDRAAVLDDCERPAGLTRTSPAIVAWIEAFGLRKGDEIRITVSSPDGSVLAQSAHVVDRDAARRFRVVGRKRTAAEWPVGVYRARYLVVRRAPSGTHTVLDLARDVDVR